MPIAVVTPIIPIRKSTQANGTPHRARPIPEITCDCNTVVYSLVMACSTCQGGIAYGWDVWSQQCDMVLISQYLGGIPQGTAIPHWAFYNVTSLNKEQFDNGNAQNIGRDPEVTAAVPQPKIPHKTTAIIGGVIGVVSLLIGIFAAYFGIKRCRENQGRKQEGQWDNLFEPPFVPEIPHVLEPPPALEQLHTLGPQLAPQRRRWIPDEYLRLPSGAVTWASRAGGSRP